MFFYNRINVALQLRQEPWDCITEFQPKFGCFHWYEYILLLLLLLKTLFIVGTFLVSVIENRQILGDANGVDNLLQALAVGFFFAYPGR